MFEFLTMQLGSTRRKGTWNQKEVCKCACTILYHTVPYMPIYALGMLEDTCIWVWRLCVSCVASYMPRRKAMDSLRQLTMKFLEKDELAGYNFQASVLCLQSGLQVCRVHDRMAQMECNVFWCWLPHVCSNVLWRYAQHWCMQLHVDTTFIVIF